jgi:uncharacterized protein (TIGR03435 family)
MSVHRQTILGVVLGFGVGLGSAQTVPAAEDAKLPRFDVASIKPNRTATPPRAGFAPNGFDAINAVARRLIELAYSDPTDRIDEILGGPRWLDAAGFNITARGSLMAAQDPQRQGRLMLQALLSDRFRLRVRREKLDRPIFALVLAARGGRTGASLTRAPLDCHTRAEARPPGTPGLMYCGIDRLPGRSIGRSMPINLLADTLTRLVGRPVVDRTGLTGEYDWDLAWTPSPGEPAWPEVDSQALAADAPSIFVALREQLGLRLEPDRAPLNVLMITSIQRPDPD